MVPQWVKHWTINCKEGLCGWAGRRASSVERRSQNFKVGRSSLADGIFFFYCLTMYVVGPFELIYPIMELTYYYNKEYPSVYLLLKVIISINDHYPELVLNYGRVFHILFTKMAISKFHRFPALYQYHWYGFRSKGLSNAGFKHFPFILLLKKSIYKQRWSLIRRACAHLKMYISWDSSIKFSDFLDLWRLELIPQCMCYD